jgi:polar amino acid transport system substrate-binding protein
MSNVLPDDVKRELAPRGIIRAGINYGNPVLAQRDPTTGYATGTAVDLARELGRDTGLDVELVTFDAAGKLVAAMQADAWDVAFLAIDPKRGADLLFTPPYLRIEGTYLVRSDSPVLGVEDVDKPGVRVAVGTGGAYDNHLTRTLKSAKLTRAPTGREAFELFLHEGLDAAAGIRQALVAFARDHPHLRVLDDRFMTIEQAVGIPRPRAAGVEYLASFLDRQKCNGFVAAALKRSGQDASIAY